MAASLPFEVPDTPALTGGEHLFAFLLKDPQIDPSQRIGLVKSMVGLINMSKTLRAELHEADLQRYTLHISPNTPGKPPNQTGSTDSAALIIWLPNMASPTNFTDGATVLTTNPADNTGPCIAAGGAPGGCAIA